MDPVDRDFDEWDAEQDALEREAEDEWVPDGRDATPEPPAYLDPRWVLRMRDRLKAYRETGIIDWLPNNKSQAA